MKRLMGAVLVLGALGAACGGTPTKIGARKTVVEPVVVAAEPVALTAEQEALNQAIEDAAEQERNDRDMRIAMEDVVQKERLVQAQEDMAEAQILTARIEASRRQDEVFEARMASFRASLGRAR